MPVFKYLDQAEGIQKHWNCIPQFGMHWQGSSTASGTVKEVSARKKVAAKFDFWRSEDVSIEM
eukprot:875537-Amphidinium_carterae.1